MSLVVFFDEFNFFLMNSTFFDEFNFFLMVSWRVRRRRRWREGGYAEVEADEAEVEAAVEADEAEVEAAQTHYSRGDTLRDVLLALSHTLSRVLIECLHLFHDVLCHPLHNRRYLIVEKIRKFQSIFTLLRVRVRVSGGSGYENKGMSLIKPLTKFMFHHAKPNSVNSSKHLTYP